MDLTEVQLERPNGIILPPSFKDVKSIWTTEPHDRVKGKYKFISSLDVIDTLAEAGWNPVSASEGRTRNEDFEGFQGHMIRLRNARQIPKINDTHVELVVQNSHAGFTSFKFMAGLFRLICSNGLVIADKTFESKRITHVSYEASKVLEIVAELADNTSSIANRIHEMVNTDLTEKQQLEFASRAAEVRGWKKAEPIEIYNPRRNEDRDKNVWSTFNVIQENILKGGIFLNGRRSRAIKSIDTNISVNQGLWELAEEYANVA